MQLQIPANFVSPMLPPGEYKRRGHFRLLPNDFGRCL